MKKSTLLLLTIAAAVVILIQSILYIKAGASAGKNSGGPAESPARLSDKVSVRAARRGNPWINLRDGRDLVAELTGADREILAGEGLAEPMALASEDFDEDGTPDLVTAHRAAKGGVLSFYRGNVDAIYPNAPEAKARKAAGSYTDAPFLSPGRLLATAEPPDFLGAGDFDADGHRDIVATARGGGSIYVLSGDGRGGFPRSKQIHLPGRVTALAAGEINRADGLADIIVGISAEDGARALVFEDLRGAIKAAPESHALPATATDFALGDFVDGYETDLAIASGSHLLVVHGRDRRSAKQSRPRITSRRFSSPINSLATGNFTGSYRFEVGVLSEEGEVAALTPVKVKSKNSRKHLKPLDQWKAEKLAKGRWPSATRLVRSRVASLPVDNLLVIDPPSGKVHIITGGAKAKALRLEATSLDVEGEAVAALAMRLNPDALTDFVILRKGQNAPSFVTTAPMATFTVTDASDSGPGTLRQAIQDANNASGADTIDFQIGTGPQTITLSSSLPDINESVTLDATTQPGFSGTPAILLTGSRLATSAGGSTIRGIAISGLDDNGIFIDINGGNIIEGTFLGLDLSGTGGSGVAGAGVLSRSASNTIGGTTTAARNVISLNGNGLDITAGDIVQGNFIGTDVTGTIDLGNLNSGIKVLIGGGFMIGGTTTGAGNVISGNDNNGIEITGLDQTGIMVLNNFIGTQADGASPLGNGANGIFIDADASNNTIGGTSTGQANTIAFNGGDGILVNTGTGNALRGNSIFSNSGLGIDLSPDGVTLNDTLDFDSGPNGLQNFPVLTTATSVDGVVNIQGTFNSSTDTGFTFDFYASTSCDQSGNGQGQIFLGSASVMTNAQGDATIDVTFPASLFGGEAITATATDPGGSTSEFSACVTVSGGGGFCVTFDNDGGDGLWENPLNWNIDSVPGPQDEVCIPSQFTVTLASGFFSIISLTNDGTLILSGGSLIANNPSSSNNLTVNSGSQLSLLSSFSVTGNITISGGSIVGIGPLDINQTATMTLTGDASFGGLTVNNSGAASWTGSGSIGIGDGAQFNNQPGATFDAQNPFGSIDGFGFMFPGAFNNAGTFRRTVSQSEIGFGSFVTFSNTGLVDVQTGRLTFFDGGTSSGVLNVASGAVIDFNIGTFTLNQGATLTGNGVFSILSDLAVNTPVTVTNFDIVTAIPSRTAARKGARKVASPSGFISGTISGPGNVTLTGTGNFAGGTMSGTGATIINSGAVLNVSGNFDKTISQRTVNNSGTVNWTGLGKIILDNGAIFNNQTGGLFHAQNDGVEIFSSSGGGAFNNAGTFRKSTAPGLINITGGVPFNNSGSVDVQSGTLSFGSGYTQTAGSLLLNGGNVITDSALNIQGGLLSGSGTINGSVVSGGQVNPGGSPGIINILGDYTQTPSGVLNIEVGGIVAGSQYDQLIISGVANLDGTLNISLINSFNPNVGDQFIVVSYGSLAGSFATINGLTIGGGRSFQPSFNTSNLTLQVVSTSQPCALTCPRDMTVNSDPARCGAVVSYTVPSVAGCGTTTCTPPPGALFPVGVTTVNCVPSSAGVGCSFNVTVVDNEPPRITCPGNITTSTTIGSAIVDYVLASTTDNCPGASAICLPPSGTVFPLGTNTVNCSATDAAGNSSTCAFIITVNDGRTPTITCPPNIIIDANPGVCSATFSYTPPVVVDSGQGATAVCTPPSGSIFPLGTTTVSCTATNQAGNRATCGFTVTVASPQIVRVSLEGGGASLQPGPVDPPIRQRNNPPQSCDCESTFTIENATCAPVTLTLSEIARTGADVDSGRITNRNDGGFFSVRMVASDQSETPLNIGSQVSFSQGQVRTFRLVFNPVVPAFTGRTTNLSASNVLPNAVTSRVVFNQGGAFPLSVVIPISGRVSTGVQLLNPENSRDNKRVIFTQAGNEFTISLAVFDSNLDVNRIRYEFLDGQGRLVDQAFDIDMTDPIRQSNMVRGQSFRVVQRFAGANTRPAINSVRVTVFDPNSNDTFTAQLQRGANGAAIQTLIGEGTIMLRRLSLGRVSRE